MRLGTKMDEGRGAGASSRSKPGLEKRGLFQSVLGRGAGSFAPRLAALTLTPRARRDPGEVEEPSNTDGSRLLRRSPPAFLLPF